VLGRPSAAALAPPRLRARGEGSTAAYRADGGSAGTLTMRAASVAGVRHRLAGDEVEDAYAWLVAGDAVVAVIADGVGSREGSSVTSRAAAGAAAAVAGEALAEGRDTEDACWSAVAAANEAVAGDTGATTLVVAVVDGAGRAVLGRVGDSTAFVLEGGAWTELWGGDAGDDTVATTATSALPSEDPDVERARAELSPGAALVLVTDGIGDPLRDGPTTVAPAFADGLARPPSPLALALLADFSRLGCHDDRTIVGLWWEPPPETEETR
jgi:serine/threonine protein phosphatase PrpC